MRRLLSLLIVFVSFTDIYAQTSELLMNENFTGYSNGNLNGQGGWRSSGNADFVQAVNSSPLVYPDYTCGSQYVNIVQKGDYSSASGNYPDDPYKLFTGGIISVVTGSTSFYISFIVRVPDAAGTQTTGNARPTIALRAVNGSTLAHFYIANDNNRADLKFGIGKDAEQEAVFAAGSYNFNTTYLIVLRYDVANGNVTSDYDDKMYMWVNPSLVARPSDNSAQAAIDNFYAFKYDGGFTGVIQSLQLFQEANSATASIDAIKIAYAEGFLSAAENATAAWDALSPAGVPIPVKVSATRSVGGIKGHPVNAGIQVEWNGSSEISAKEYEIERSSDGVSFRLAATAAPGNVDSMAYYDWLDISPLPGNNYYRIKKEYKDGETLYSHIVKVRPGNSSTIDVGIYPNPVTDNHISLQAADLRKGEYGIEIYSTSGQQVYKKQFSHAGGAISKSLELPHALQTGIYNIQLTGNGFKLAKQFLIQ